MTRQKIKGGKIYVFGIRFRFVVSVLLLALLPLASFTAYFATTLNINMHNEREDALKNHTYIAISLIEASYNSYMSGYITEEQAKQQAIDNICELRFGKTKSDYFWIQNITEGSPVMVMHPYKTDLDGQDLTNFTDPNGKHLFVEFQECCENNGEGFVDYQWQYYDEADNIVDKISFVKEFEEWGWIIGTGIYLMDVNVVIQEELLILGSISLVATLVIIFAGILISSRITKPIVKLNESCAEIAKGNLTVNVEQIKGQAEMKNLVNSIHQMTANLRNRMLEMSRMSQSLAISAEELSDTSQSVSSSSENIAGSQQQISKGASNQVIAISEIQSKFGDLLKMTRYIREKTEDIQQISDLIQGISNQTNMLALNAAIEAARAGEAGRGFNVVAEQVRKLAEESRKAVDNTSKMLEEITQHTRQQEQSSLRIMEQIDSIATVAEETSASTEEAAAAAEEQAASMELITSTSHRLSKFADELTDQILKVKLDDETIQDLASSLESDD